MPFISSHSYALEVSSSPYPINIMFLIVKKPANQLKMKYLLRLPKTLDTAAKENVA